MLGSEGVKSLLILNPVSDTKEHSQSARVVGHRGSVVPSEPVGVKKRKQKQNKKRQKSHAECP